MVFQFKGKEVQCSQHPIVLMELALYALARCAECMASAAMAIAVPKTSRALRIESNDDD